MSLKRMAMKMALAYAAAKGVQAFRNNGGLSGLKRSIGQMQGGAQNASSGIQGRVGGTGTTTGGLGSLLGGLSSGGAAGGSGLGGLLGALGGQGSTVGGGMSGGGMGGLLGGLAAMAGGSAALGSDADMAQHAEAGPSDEATAGVMIRAMAQAVRADGEIDAQERQVLMELLDDANDPGDREAVEAALNEPIDPEGLARDVPAGHEAEVYAAALTAIDPDRAPEREFLSRFASALDMRPSEVRQLHEAQGKPV
ncbi:DUF533 domain-containing protein [Jannaschia sp. Os4]|uniref:DUF533 domain-containing protein n=1 Tax=Jannaschia sp. Os4 TaxID=2807617 RepID=UPI00193AAA1B|nr:DUF533 domain-containing protein [Jannaschia sp. Os4]MBM2576565.1 DUF533 domain-containing protein [Jannaschia sp. Os4]